MRFMGKNNLRCNWLFRFSVGNFYFCDLDRVYKDMTKKGFGKIVIESYKIYF